MDRGGVSQDGELLSLHQLLLEQQLGRTASWLGPSAATLSLRISSPTAMAAKQASSHKHYILYVCLIVSVTCNLSPALSVPCLVGCSVGCWWVGLSKFLTLQSEHLFTPNGLSTSAADFSDLVFQLFSIFFYLRH